MYTSNSQQTPNTRAFTLKADCQNEFNNDNNNDDNTNNNNNNNKTNNNNNNKCIYIYIYT